MFKAFVTGAIISKGYGDAPAVRFTEKCDCVRFRIGKLVYDKNAENNKRWLNINVKAFGGVCERIQKMQLAEGSYVNICARYDEEHWVDKDTNEQKSAPVLIVSEIEYCFSEKKDSDGIADNAASESQPIERNGAPNEQTGLPGSFTGFEGFSGKNPFFET